MPTLDVPEKQVFIDFFADVNGFHWHHRILLVSLGDGKWICCTPDQSVQRVNLADHRVVILGRNAAYPADRVAITYAPDNADFDAPTLARLRAEALALAEVLGVQPAAGGAVAAVGNVVWRVCDTASEHFGEELPAACVGNDQVFVERGDRALAEVDGEWLSAAKEAPDEPGLDAFTKRFHAGPGRDPRVLSRTLDSQGRRLLPLEKAFSITGARPGLSRPRPEFVIAPCSRITATKGSDFIKGIKRFIPEYLGRAVGRTRVIV